MPLSLEGRILAFTALLGIATGVLFGLVPALHASRSDLVPALKETAGLAGAGRARPLRLLVMAQMVVSTVALVTAGLFVRSLASAQTIDVGFDPEGIVLTAVDLDLQGYELEDGRLFFRELTERVETLPGVVSVGLVENVPFDLDVEQHSMAPEGYEPPPNQGLPVIDRNVVTHSYFETMRIPLLSGRDFTDEDDAEAPPVGIVNEALAERFWPNENAIGKFVGQPGRMYEVVGVVETGKYLFLSEDPKPLFYYPFLQRASLEMTLVIRTSSRPESLLAAVRNRVHEMDPALPVFKVKTMEEHLEFALAPARAGAAFLGSFGLLALVLASVGLYGVLAFTVAARTSEIGIRRALGAQSRDVFGPVVREGLVLALSGLILGVVASVFVSRLTASVLYGIDGNDPWAFSLAILVLLLTALAASYVPARRAARVDPITALRYE